MKAKRLVRTRLPVEMVEQLETIGNIEQSDRSTTIRRLLSRAIRDWKLDHHGQRYALGQLSLARCAREAGVSVWEMMDYVQSRKIRAQYDEDDLAHDMERLRLEARSSAV